MIIGEDNIPWVHMRTQLAALKLEMFGMKHSRGSVYAHIKKQYGFSGNKERVYRQLQELVEANRPKD